jgi:hypothetical protein
MVIVSESVHTRHHAEFLSRHIAKFDEITRDLEGGITPATQSIRAAA